MPASGIANKGFGDMRSVVARSNISCTLIGNRLVICNFSYRKPVVCASLKNDNDVGDNYDKF